MAAQQTNPIAERLIELSKEAVKNNQELLNKIPDSELENYPHGADLILEELRPISKEIATKFYSEYAPKMKFNLKGHIRSLLDGTTLDKQSRENFVAYALSLESAIDGLSFDMECLITELNMVQRLGIKEHKSMSLRMLFRGDYFMIFGTDNLECPDCGEKINAKVHVNTLEIVASSVFRKTVDDKRSYVDCPECPMPNGVGHYSVNINVPSGKLVVGNALTRILNGANQCKRKEIDDAQSDYFSKHSDVTTISINSNAGKKLNSEFYADTYNFAYMPAGNQTTQGYLDSETGVITFKDEYVYLSESEEEVSTVSDTETEVSYVCCDLWAVTAMDYDEFKKLCDDYGCSIDDGLGLVTDGCVVDVEAGTHTFTSYYMKKKESDMKRETLFTISKTKDNIHQ